MQLAGRDGSKYGAPDWPLVSVSWTCRRYVGKPYTRKLESTGWLGTKWYKHAPTTKKRPQCLLMLDMNPDSLHTLSTDTSFCKLLFDDIKTLRFGGRHSRSWFPGIPSPDPHRCSVSLSGCHLWISSQSSIQSEKIGWSLTCHQCYKLSKILVQFFWGQKSPKS